MPYIFTFYIHHHIRFRAQMLTKECICHSANHMRCRNKTVIGSPYCWVHLLYQRHLRIKDSNIHHAGKGLFALNKDAGENEIIFRKGTNIIRYDGEIIDHQELNRRYGDFTAPYGIEISQNRFEDGALERGAGTLINHTTRDRANCKFIISKNNRDDTLNHKIVIRATKNIRNGQELLASYGGNYRLNEPQTDYRTAYEKL